MKTLIMDTATKYLGIGIYEDGLLLTKYLEKSNKQQSEEAIVKLEEQLTKVGLKLLDIDQMIVTIGPGSYTGVRVALTIAKTLAATSDIKLKVVSSLRAYCGLDKAIGVIDARGGKIYVGVYKNGQAVETDQLINIDGFSKLQTKYPRYQVVGDSEIVGIKSKEIDIIDNINSLDSQLPVVANPDALVPNYIKQVIQ